MTINDGFEDEVYDSMFFKEHLEELDKYPVFLDGNHNFERIVNNDNEDGKKVLVIKTAMHIVSCRLWLKIVRRLIWWT